MDENREKLAMQYPDFKAFEAKFEVSDKMIDKIIEEGNSEGVTHDEKSIEFARPLLKKQIKSLVARDLYSLSHYFQIMNKDDQVLNKAIEILQNKGEYERLLGGKYLTSN
jgi:carboxyl-terminal processing protease